MSSSGIPDHAQRVQQEIDCYAAVEHVHDLPTIFHYWSNRYLLPKLKDVFRVTGLDDVYIKYVLRHASRCAGPVSIVSLGAGNCDLEVRLAENLRAQQFSSFTFTCVDLNDQMLARGEQQAAAAGLASHFAFEKSDVSTWRPRRNSQVVIVSHFLHHVVELEHLFAAIKEAICPDGYFVTNDVFGRNGHMRWPEVLSILDAIWREMPEAKKYNHQLQRVERVYENWDCAAQGFEGIRAQDILPLLLQHFDFDAWLAFGGLIDLFVDRSFGPNFSIDDPGDLAFIDAVARLNDNLIDCGIIKPTLAIAALRSPGSGVVTRWHRHWKPQFCLRPPDGLHRPISAFPPEDVSEPRPRRPSVSVGRKGLFAENGNPPALHQFQARPDSLPFGDGALDLVTIDSESVEGYEPGVILLEAARVLSADSVVLVDVPEPAWHSRRTASSLSNWKAAVNIGCSLALIHVEPRVAADREGNPTGGYRLHFIKPGARFARMLHAEGSNVCGTCGQWQTAKVTKDFAWLTHSADSNAYVCLSCGARNATTC